MNATQSWLESERLALARFASTAYPNSAAAIEGWRRALDAADSLFDRVTVSLVCPVCRGGDCSERKDDFAR